ncbi:hypothetical protein Tco_1219483 [Tanacetum coccineum]
MSWSCKHLMSIRDKIREFVNVKIGNGKTCHVWFDKWHPRGPLSKLIDHRVIYLAGLDINAKVIDLIENNNWCWPIDWMTEYDTVIDVLVPKMNNDVEDRTIWCNKKGKEKEFSASEVWKAIKIDYPKADWSQLILMIQSMFFDLSKGSIPRYVIDTGEGLIPMDVFDVSEGSIPRDVQDVNIESIEGQEQEETVVGDDQEDEVQEVDEEDEVWEEVDEYYKSDDDSSDEDASDEDASDEHESDED